MKDNVCCSIIVRNCKDGDLTSTASDAGKPKVNLTVDPPAVS